MTTATNEGRESRSDAKADPTVWHVYILKLEDGTYYIGQTNDALTRVLEHATGAGAVTTAGKTGKLVWFNQTHSREAARAMESRLQTRLDTNPASIDAIVDQFRGLIALVQPQKTLAQLRKEESDYNLRMASLFHWTPNSANRVLGMKVLAACGWDGGPERQLFGTNSIDDLIKDAKVVDAVLDVAGEYEASGAVRGRLPCRDCLALKPENV